MVYKTLDTKKCDPLETEIKQEMTPDKIEGFSELKKCS